VTWKRSIVPVTGEEMQFSGERVEVDVENVLEIH